jgi:hypothetical protein
MFFEIADQVSAKIMAQLTTNLPTGSTSSHSHVLPDPPDGSECPTTPSSHGNTTPKPGEELHHITLGDGSVLNFTLDDVPDPIAVTFVQDICRLNAMWDDDSSHWGGESVLTIRERPIPIKYWPEVYRYGKAGQWAGTKSRWTDWRVCYFLHSTHF